MSFFKTRSDYFKSLATKNKLIAHDADIDGGGKRKSFFRMNDEEELNAAAINWMHFPCMVHLNFSGKYSASISEVEKRTILNEILILDKIISAADMNSLESVRDSTFDLMEDIISRMMNEFEEQEYCSPFKGLDLSQFSFVEYGPINATLYGWRLTFSDEQFPEEITNYDASKWND